MNDFELQEKAAAMMPEWAKEMLESHRMICTRNFALSLEVDRLQYNEGLSESTNEQFDEWTDEFFRLKGLDHLIDEYHEFITKKVDEDE